MVKVWFEIKELQNKVGVITDLYGNYIEVYCEEIQDYYIRHIDKIEIIKKQFNNA